MFARVLIANRGEIAVRIIETCRQMGIQTVAVYSSADEDALHVQMADEAYWIGPAPAIESYLNGDAIIAAAKESSADALHPGYGFLAENPRFARSVEEAGIRWIGPPSDVIALMGDKVAAKALAASAGVPVVPGYDGEELSLERVSVEAARIGYPLMIKASAGGGGKGMRTVGREADLEPALDGARREARSAFGDDRVFLERLVPFPRHIEIQVVADTHGEVAFLGERDCSVQRRHQKVVEEAPSPVMTAELRAEMGGAAVRLAQASHYVNAGTVEFLYSNGDFYFLEMNTRIQVEHPVTEAVTGLDLVRLQIEIAAGRQLSLDMADTAMQGHAIEVRLYAEDAAHDFLPATGTLSVFDPPAGPGIRNDVGTFQGAHVTPYYDPMLAKLIVHAGDRNQAVARLADALDRYRVAGVTTNLPFLHWIVGQSEFTKAGVDVDFVDRSWHGEAPRDLPDIVLVAAAIFRIRDGRGAGMTESAANPWRAFSGWRQLGQVRRFRCCWEGVERALDLVPVAHNHWRVEVDGKTLDVEVRDGAPGVLLLMEGPKVLRFGVAADGGDTVVDWHGREYCIQSPDAFGAGNAGQAGKAGESGLSAPMPGTVVKVVVQAGDRVAAQQPLVTMEAMKMEHVIHAPREGVVKAVLFDEGDMVPAGAAVVQLESA